MAFADDHSEEVVGMLIEMPDVQGSVVLRAERVVAALEELAAAGFILVLLPAGTTVRLKKSRLRWWGRERRRRT